MEEQSGEGGTGRVTREEEEEEEEEESRGCLCYESAV